MNVYRENNLVNKLFENIIIFSGNCSVVYSGCRITALLEQNSITINLPKELSIAIEGSMVPLQELITKVISGGEPIVFNFPKIPDSFILLPSVSCGKKTAVLGLSGVVEYAIRIENKLEDSVKEIQCLYNVSKALETHPDLNEALNLCVAHINQGFSYPAETPVWLEIKNKIYGSPEVNNPADKNILRQEIIVNGVKYGAITASLKNGKWFLKEETNMLKEIAGKIAMAVEKDEKQKNLEKQQAILLAKNEALIKLTEDCNRNRQKLRTFFSAITEKIIVIDNDFNITISNKEEIGDAGKCYKKLFDRNERCSDCPALEVFVTGNSSSRERVEGDKFLRLTGYPIFSTDGKVDRVLEVCIDTTTQKKMEEQLLQSYKLASLGKLVAGVAHEINNPNTFIMGNLKIIEESLGDIIPILDDYYASHPELKIARLNYNVFRDNIPVLVHDMIGGANRTKKIVSDLRNFAKKDEGKLTDKVDLNDVINNNLTLPAKHIKKHAKLEVELGEGIPVFTGSINKLEQILINLIMNASEAIGPAEGLIKIKTFFDPARGEAVLTVTDNGCGISDDARKNIFDPFYTTKRNSGGTGLGLSITYGLVKEHGGSIDVESKPGKGSCFIVRLPVERKNN